MTPSYMDVCKKLLRQKQLADKRNGLLYKKVSILEKKAIELERLNIKCEELSRDNLFLALELKELKISNDTASINNLEEISKIELVKQILALKTQNSALEKTNTELWIDQRRLSRQLAALKPSPLSMICDSNDHIDKALVAENNTSKPTVKRSSSTPIKTKNRDRDATKPPTEKGRIATPPFAVIPPWCHATVQDDSCPESTVDSTIFSDYVDHEPSFESNLSFTTSTSYRRIEIRRPQSPSILSATFQPFDDDTPVADSTSNLSSEDEFMDSVADNSVILDSEESGDGGKRTNEVLSRM